MAPVGQYRPSKPQSRCFPSTKIMTPFRGKLKRSLSHNGFSTPDVDPLSDSSASSSSCCEAVGCPPSSLSSRPLHIPLEIGGDQFVPVIPPNKQKRVLFGDIEIRKYPIILGDHPECTMGPPLTIDWEPFRAKIFSIDSYESKRGVRRTKDELQLGWLVRKQILRKHAEATDEEMRLAAYEAQRVRDQRNQTKKQLRYDFVYAPIEVLNRKARQFFR